MTEGHGRISYRVKGRDGKLSRYGREGEIGEVADIELADLTPATETYAYTHIFGKAASADLPSEQALSDLGAAMMAEPRALDADSCIPAGYTYFGQFVFHDMTFLTPGKACNGRSPALDLDSVLPEEDEARYRGGSPALGPLWIGATTDEKALPGDLPRERNDTCPCPGKPVIADERNDDFLPLAQCHLALLRFYNAIARWCGYGCQPGVIDDHLNGEIRRLWVKHFQWAVLHDYLPRIVGDEIHEAVMTKGRVIVHPEPFRDAGSIWAHAQGGRVIVHPEPFRDPSKASLRTPADRDWMPLEFGAAVGRFGHSMIRSEYRPWNARFDHPAMPPVTLRDFIMLSYRNSEDQLGGVGRGLPMFWLTDWLVLFDFSETDYAHLAPRPMMANRIDTRLAGVLGHLPQRLLADHRNDQGEFNLAEHTLRHGWRMRLVSAQEAIRQLNAALPGQPIVPLEHVWLWDDARPAVRDVFRRHSELGTKTPLWYYVLREAEIVGRGNRLGPLGGRIVMETLHAAIEASEISILDGSGWRPTLPRACADNFTVPDLIAFCGNPDPLGTAEKPK